VSGHAVYKDQALRIEDALLGLGYKVRLSELFTANGSPVNDGAVQEGINDSAALLLLLTHGIFHADLNMVWETEVKHAIDIGKPVICICDNFDLSARFRTCDHFKEVCWPEGHGGVAADMDLAFQPYARAIVAASPIIKFDLSGNTKTRRVRSFTFAMEDVLDKFAERHSATKRLMKRLKMELALGTCELGKTVLDQQDLDVACERNFEEGGPFSERTFEEGDFICYDSEYCSIMKKDAERGTYTLKFHSSDEIIEVGRSERGFFALQDGQYKANFDVIAPDFEADSTLDFDICGRELKTSFALDFDMIVDSPPQDLKKSITTSDLTVGLGQTRRSVLV